MPTELSRLVRKLVGSVIATCREFILFVIYLKTLSLARDYIESHYNVLSEKLIG
jgi:nucleoside diphosphate kinase